MRPFEQATWEDLLTLLEAGPTCYDNLVGKLTAQPVSEDADMIDPGSVPERQKVRPIQAGEFLRRFTSRRLLAIDRDDINAVSVSMRQFGGAGVPGGMEALIHFQKAVRKIARSGKARIPLCRVSIDQENFFGPLLWEEIRREVMDVMPWRAGVLRGSTPP